MPEDAKKSCCTPPAEHRSSVAAHDVPVTQADRVFPAIDIPGGEALVGTDDPQIPLDGEGPLKRVNVNPFSIGATTVTNAEFAEFVDATGHVTEAEKFGWSFVFWTDIPQHLRTEGVQDLEWWRRVDGANWRNVCGPGTSGESWKPNHPVVHVSWRDARAYAKWAGGRLPTEVEWEHAARGGLGDERFPWGDLEPDDRYFHPCNIWQGNFPEVNTQSDGWKTTAPAESFEPNGYGLYNCVGNVWEWTADLYRVKSKNKSAKKKAAGMRGHRLLKGGSFLCHRSYCYRYRIAARTGNTPDSTTTHQGFRVVWDIDG